MGLVEFLTARLADDERTAREAIVPACDRHKPHAEMAEWTYEVGGEVEYTQRPYGEPFYVTCDSEGILPAVDEKCGPHIARHDPARVLREVTAKRRILEAHHPIDPCDAHDGVTMETVTCDTLLALATCYGDHPDYNPEWSGA